MKYPVLTSVFALCALLLISGCVNLNHDTTQTFKSDGTSQLSIVHQIGVSKELVGVLETSVNSQGYMGYGIPIKYVGLAVKLVDLTFDSYSNTICDMAKGSANCTVDSEGAVHLTANLKPDTDFYTVKTTTDWANLQEVKTYEIERVPTVAYFAASGKTGREFGQAFVKKFATRLNAGFAPLINQYIDTDFICMPTTTGKYSCSVVSTRNGNARFNITSPISIYSMYSSNPKVVWAACTNHTEEELTDLAGYLPEGYYYTKEINSSLLAPYVQTITQVDKTPTSKGIDFTAACAADSKGLVLVYEDSTYVYSENYSDSIEVPVNSTTYIPLISKADILENVSSGLDELASDSGFTSATDRYGANMSYYLLNFVDGKLSQMDFSALNDTLGKMEDASSKANLKVSFTYSARFPDHVVSAYVGEKKVALDGDGFMLNVADMAALGRGRIIVKTERSLSPFGAMTWMIPIVVILLVFVWLVVRKAAGKEKKERKK